MHPSHCPDPSLFQMDQVEVLVKELKTLSAIVSTQKKLLCSVSTDTVSAEVVSTESRVFNVCGLNTEEWPESVHSALRNLSRVFSAYAKAASRHGIQVQHEASSFLLRFAPNSVEALSPERTSDENPIGKADSTADDEDFFDAMEHLYGQNGNVPPPQGPSFPTNSDQVGDQVQELDRQETLHRNSNLEESGGTRSDAALLSNALGPGLSTKMKGSEDTSHTVAEGAVGGWYLLWEGDSHRSG